MTVNGFETAETVQFIYIFCNRRKNNRIDNANHLRIQYLP